MTLYALIPAFCPNGSTHACKQTCSHTMMFKQVYQTFYQCDDQKKITFFVSGHSLEIGQLRYQRGFPRYITHLCAILPQSFVFAFILIKSIDDIFIPYNWNLSVIKNTYTAEYSHYETLLFLSQILFVVVAFSPQHFSQLQHVNYILS